MYLLGFVLAFGVWLVSGQTQCPGVTFVTRTQWGARSSRSNDKISGPVDYVFIHHTTGSSCTTSNACKSSVKSMQTFHMDTRGWDDIGYSFLIGGDGVVYIGRDWGRVGAHTTGYNSVAYAISFIGTYTNQLPSAAMISNAKKLIACGVAQGYVKKDYGLYGHRDGGCTECPGNSFYKSLSSWQRWHARGATLRKYC